MKQTYSAVGKRIPHKLRRLPLVRNVRWFQYWGVTDTPKYTKALRSVFPELLSEGDSIEYDHTYVLAMSARVGSTAMVEWLRKSGLSNFQIREIFNNGGQVENNVEEWETHSLSQYLNAYATRSGARRLPFKIGWWDMAALYSLINEDLDTWLPDAKWVYLERRDKVAQAYSLWKAAEHGVWHRRQGEQYISPVTKDIPVDLIRQRLMLIEQENECWKLFFDENKITPHCVYYEDFLAEPFDTMAKVYEAFTSKKIHDATESTFIRSTDETDLANLDWLRAKL